MSIDNIEPTTKPSREPKFRAWSEKYSKYLTDYSHPIGSDASVCIGLSGGAYIQASNCNQYDEEISWSVDIGVIILEQYTGLKDNNGKEICESDRIKEYDGCIVFQDGAFWVDHVHTYGRKQTLLIEWIRKRNKSKTFVDVIGNIHE